MRFLCVGKVLLLIIQLSEKLLIHLVRNLPWLHMISGNRGESGPLKSKNLEDKDIEAKEEKLQTSEKNMKKGGKIIDLFLFSRTM